ncbi:MAG: 4-hydroxy-3-methylbut-2-enyl diphosphate reductase [Proteobacteria bacterium]|nr:4-hydroxy-3-methylbut-2-enyl diphosphate reductase [Pseudomonadota bacterium]
MEVILAAHAGFCMGVRRAVETTIEIVRKEDEGIATFGPLIHNPQVLDLLNERGVRVLDHVPEKGEGTIIIRAHGIPPALKQQLIASGARVQDATCPRVVKVQVIIKKYRNKGYSTVIIGDRNHAEVEGLMGYAGENCHVVSSEQDLEKLKVAAPYIIVSQTTQDEISFENISQKILEYFPGGEVFNTICDSTHKRQEEVRKLCEKVQAMVVVGGKASANTQRLGKIAQGMGCPVFMIENQEDLDIKALSAFDCVGVTAGASTPSWMIKWVVRALEAVPGKSDGLIRPVINRFLWLLLATNFYISLGGGLMAYAFGKLLSGEQSGANFFLAFGYLFSMHNINRFTDQRSKKINDPIRALFYRRYRWTFLIASAIALTGSLTLAFGMGSQSFLLLLGMSILGVLYSVRFIPKSLSTVTRVRGLKEIPGSKSIFVAMAWAFVIVVVPAFESSTGVTPYILGGTIIVFLLAYLRSALFDVFDILGDRLVGKETLPVWIGEKRTLLILHVINALLIIIVLSAPLMGLLPVAAYWLGPGIIYQGALVYFYDKGRFREGFRLEFAVETTVFIIAFSVWFAV